MIFGFRKTAKEALHVLLDTTFLVDLIRGDPGARAFLEAAEGGSEALRVPAPALARFWEALERSRAPPRDVLRVRAVLERAASAPFTAAHAVEAGRVLARSAREGAPLDPFDAMVAAMALVDGEALVSRNAGELGRVEGLRLRAY